MVKKKCLVVVLSKEDESLSRTGVLLGNETGIDLFGYLPVSHADVTSQYHSPPLWATRPLCSQAPSLL